MGEGAKAQGFVVRESEILHVQHEFAHPEPSWNVLEVPSGSL